MLLVQLGINSTRDVWKFAKLDSPRQFWQNFQTSLVLLIPNCTRHRMITYTKSGEKVTSSLCLYSKQKSRKQQTNIKSHRKTF